MYKVGYFFHLNGAVDKTLVLCFSGCFFRFYVVKKELIPWKYWNVDYRQRRIPKYPVLCFITGDDVSEIVFLNDVPVSNGDETYQGYCITKEGTTHLLCKDGQSIIGYQNKIGEKEKSFFELFTNIIYVQKEIKKLDDEINFFHYSNLSSHRYEIISKYQKIIDSFDITKIVSSLKIQNVDHMCKKIGDDESYYIDRVVELEDKNVIVDDYIRSLVGIGTENIYSDTGFMLAEKLKMEAQDFIDKNPLGLYSDEKLNIEKQRIIDKYSREAHMAFLFFEQFEKIEKANKKIVQEKLALDKLLDILNTDYSYTKLSNINEQFFYKLEKMDQDFLELLKILNNHIMRIQKNVPVLRVLISGGYKSRKKDEQIENAYRCGYVRFPEYLDYQDEVRKDCDLLWNTYYKKVEAIINDLSKDYIVEIVVGNNCKDHTAGDVEGIAEDYAIRNSIVRQFVQNPRYSPLSSNEEDSYFLQRSQNLVECAEQIFILGNFESKRTKYIISVATKSNKPIKMIE